MPLISSTYEARGIARNGHVQTVVMGICRRAPKIHWARSRYHTGDGDFYDVDWQRRPGHRRLAVVLHGLEGSARSAYVRSLADQLGRSGWDVAAINLRGCSGELNRSVGFYHSGLTDDLAGLLSHSDVESGYDHVGLVGFSLGGNILLKYLGDRGRQVPARICGAVAVSVPCDLTHAGPHMDRPANQIYTRYLVRSLCRKIRAKARVYPGRLNLQGLDRIRTFSEFDDRFTAPLHGFIDAHDYWGRASGAAVADRIRVPTLLINARDDPFLPAGCFPWEIARRSPWLYLETPASGGHLGFADSLWRRTSWMDGRIRRFLDQPTPGTE